MQNSFPREALGVESVSRLCRGSVITLVPVNKAYVKEMLIVKTTNFKDIILIFFLFGSHLLDKLDSFQKETL